MWLRSTLLYNHFTWVQIKIFKAQKKLFLTLFLSEIEYLEKFRWEIILAEFYIGKSCGRTFHRRGLGKVASIFLCAGEKERSPPPDMFELWGQL